MKSFPFGRVKNQFAFFHGQNPPLPRRQIAEPEISDAHADQPQWLKRALGSEIGAALERMIFPLAVSLIVFGPPRPVTAPAPDKTARCLSTRNHLFG